MFAPSWTNAGHLAIGAEFWRGWSPRKSGKLQSQRHLLAVYHLLSFGVKDYLGLLLSRRRGSLALRAIRSRKYDAREGIRR